MASASAEGPTLEPGQTLSCSLSGAPSEREDRVTAACLPANLQLLWYPAGSRWEQKWNFNDKQFYGQDQFLLWFATAAISLHDL